MTSKLLETRDFRADKRRNKTWLVTSDFVDAQTDAEKRKFLGRNQSPKTVLAEGYLNSYTDIN